MENWYSNRRIEYELSQLPGRYHFFIGERSRKEHDFYCADACVLGDPSFPENGSSIDGIPFETRGLYMYYGAGIKNLLAELFNTPISAKLEYLTIGITHNNAKDYADYSEISKLLSGRKFPNLKHFEYGIDELIVNESCIYGNLGDITEVLKNMPNLETLSLYGNFRLTEPVPLIRLKTLFIQMDDPATHINGGKITNDTLQHLLKSTLPSLTYIDADLSFNDKLYEYTLPDEFLNGQSAPALKTLELFGNFMAGAKLKISQSHFLAQSVDVEDHTHEPEGSPPTP